MASFPVPGTELLKTFLSDENEKVSCYVNGLILGSHFRMGLVARKANLVGGWNFQFEQTRGDGERQGSLECCSPWGHKESDTTEHPTSNSTVSVPPPPPKSGKKRGAGKLNQL